MAIAIIFGRDEEDRKRFTFFYEKFPPLLKAMQSNLDLRIYPDIGNPQDIDFVIVWRPPFKLLSQLPHLKCIASSAAGVDHLFEDPDLPTNIPIVRIVDPAMSIEITQYIVATVLYWQKRFDLWAQNQQQKKWNRTTPFNFSDKTVGIMGLGFLGAQAAQALHSLGINVIGWSQSPKKITSIQTYSGQEEFEEFLSQSHALVCMLPLTLKTTGILNIKNFNHLPRDAYLINLGRGGHLVEADLLAALASGQLSGACLDVFREEPLPSHHPFWTHPQIRITPHIASVTNPDTAVAQIYENYQRVMSGRPLLNQVDLHKGY